MENTEKSNRQKKETQKTKEIGKIIYKMCKKQYRNFKFILNRLLSINRFSKQMSFS